MNRNGFTLIEMVVVLAVVAVLAAILVPEIANHIKDSKITRAVNEEQVIVAAIMLLYKDTGKWPNTNANGPTGNVDRLLTGMPGDPIATGILTGSRTGAINWGANVNTKQLGDFLFFNNPDNDIGATGQNQSGEDYPIRGKFAWRGPYIDQEGFVDPWGYQYVISATYFPGSPNAASHRSLILSAGPDGLWSTAYDPSVTRLTTPSDEAYGPYEHDGARIHDDIGKIIATNN